MSLTSAAVRVLGPDNAVDIDKPSAHLELEASPTKPSKRKKRASIEITEDRPKSDGISYTYSSSYLTLF